VYASTESGNGDALIVVLLLQNLKKIVRIIKERVVVFYAYKAVFMDVSKKLAKIVDLRKKKLLSKNVPTTKQKVSVTYVHLIITVYINANYTHA